MLVLKKDYSWGRIIPIRDQHLKKILDYDPKKEQTALGGEFHCHSLLLEVKQVQFAGTEKCRHGESNSLIRKEPSR